MGPSKGELFGEASVSGRPGRSNACRSCGERQCASALIHTHPRTSTLSGIAPREMDLGNYLLL